MKFFCTKDVEEGGVLIVIAKKKNIYIRWNKWKIALKIKILYHLKKEAFFFGPKTFSFLV